MLKTGLLFCGIAMTATSASSATMEISLIGKIDSYGYASTDIGSYYEGNDDDGYSIVGYEQLVENYGKDARITLTYDSADPALNAQASGQSNSWVQWINAIQSITVWVGEELFLTSNSSEMEFYQSAIGVTNSGRPYQEGPELDLYHDFRYFGGALYPSVNIDSRAYVSVFAGIEDFALDGNSALQALADCGCGSASLSLASFDIPYSADDALNTWFSNTDISFTITTVTLSGDGVGEVDPGETPAPVPLPAGGVLLGTGLLALAGYRRRK